MKGFFVFTRKWKFIFAFGILLLPDLVLDSISNGIDIFNLLILILIYTSICIAPLTLDIIYYKTPAEKLWKKWENVIGVQQEKRKERAKNVELTPLHVYPEIKAAIFLGFSGGNKYRTTFRKCTCPDFQKRKVPCKHMYYLANKCGLEK